MKAIVDCNNFYCSCERLFRPSLDNKPVVVLSNNDGCIISRSDEAKQAGIQMAAPYFIARPQIERHEVTVFSSNYNLYGDLSWRVMETLRELVGKNNVEVYSVDEAFIDLDGFATNELDPVARNIRAQVEQWTGIKVSIGIAPTKVLAKLANRLAKKNKVKTGCVLLLDTKEKIDAALRKTPIGDIWGIGRRYAEKLRSSYCIFDAYQLANMTEEFAHAQLGGVVGGRLFRELNGIPSLEMEDELTRKKMIATTRMFGHPVNDIVSIREAVATYTSRAAEKLRRQHSAARSISVFVVMKDEDHNTDYHGASYSASTKLASPTTLTHELIKSAGKLVDELFVPGKFYKKAGVILADIVPDNAVQGNLFSERENNAHQQLMNMIDNVNFSQRDDVLKFACAGTTRNWKMQQNHISPRYTTRWNELCEVK